jgi:adenylosuccinate synthase
MNKAYLIQGLLYGDEGKGRSVNDIVQFSGASAVIRFNGGPQAAHNVITADSRHHTFNQFGSATMQPGVKTILSKHMLINPITMWEEDLRLQQVGVHDALARTYVDSRAPILTPFHQNLNRLRELCRETPHGTCAHGVGELMLDKQEKRTVLYAGDLLSMSAIGIRRTLGQIRLEKCIQAEELQNIDKMALRGHNDFVRKQFAALATTDQSDQLLKSIQAQMVQWANQVIFLGVDHLADLLKGMDTVVFEGAQGVLLDENYGFAPYNTWSTTTFANAEEILIETGTWAYTEVQKIGVLRTLATRHGPGPLVTEDEELTHVMVEPHNETNAWQKAFRFGHLDMVALRYAIDVLDGINFLAITHMDRSILRDRVRVCERYNYHGGSFRLQKPDKVLSQSGLYHQFTKPLGECEPIYNEIPFYDLKNYISAELDTRVGMVSYGPKANERKIYL